MMCKLVLTLFLIVITIDVTGQSPYLIEHPFPQEFRQTKILKLYEEPSGFIWLGTNRGLFKYNGLNYEQIEFSDNAQEFAVTAIFEDQQNGLWIGTRSGDIFRSTTGIDFFQWDPPEGTPKVPITGFIESNDNTLFISTYGEGIYYLEDGRLYNIDTDDGMISNDVNQLSYSVTYDWVIAATDNGVDLVKASNQQKQIKHIGLENGLPDILTKDMLVDSKGNLWVGFYENGFCHIDLSTFEIKHIQHNWQYGEINSIELFEGIELWIATNKRGLLRFDFYSDTSYPIELGIEEANNIHDLKKDIEGNVWLCLQGNRILSTNRLFEIEETIPSSVQAIVADRHLGLWVGTKEGLFYKENALDHRIAFEKIDRISNKNVISLYLDNFENLWIGTFGEGLYCYSPISDALKKIEISDQISSDNILDIEGRNGHLWLATLGGVKRIKISGNVMQSGGIQQDPLKTDELIGSNFIYDIFFDSKGRAWFATDGNGLVLKDDSRINKYTHSDSIEFRSVYCIAEDFDGNIWFSTAKSGLIKFDGNSFYQLTLKEGLRDLTVTGLKTDEKGNIVIIHSYGIDILDPKTNHLIYYDDEVGVENIEPELNAVNRDQRGNIWIGSQSNLIKYSYLEENFSIHPRTKITNVLVNLQPVNYNTDAVFGYGSNNFIFEYIGLWFTDPKTVEYRYKLEGYNEDWIISKDQRAVYSQLAPGNYTFYVSSTENDAFAHEPIIQYSFRIKLPIWKQLWFLGLLGLILVLTGYYIIKDREKRIEREGVIQEEKIKSQYEVLKSQINPHFLFNSFNTLMSLIDEDPKVAGEFTEKLSDFYRSILQYRSQELISVQEEIELVENYFFLQQKRYGDNIRIEICQDELHSFIPPMTIQILLENAIKHNIISKHKPLKIRIDLSKETEIHVSNNIQHKLNTEPSTGFGLESIKKRYSLLTDRKIKINQDNGVYEVILPKILKSNP